MIQYKFDEPDTSTLYIGEAATNVVTSQAFWKIRKLSTSGSVTSIQYADGDDQFDNVWDNRTSLSYS